MIGMFEMAEKIETRWDGITTVAATLGITVVSAVGMYRGILNPETLIMIVAALSGIGGYSMHNLVRRGGDK